MRRIIKIDEELCNGCGLCAKACHEGAIRIENGIAKLVYENYCDGLGDCLPACPVGAISFEERDAPEYNEEAVKKSKESVITTLPCACPGDKSGIIKESVSGQLRQWPVQINLVPVSAPYFEKSNILISADCAAYAVGDFHDRFIKGRITLIGCPKLDRTDYSEKLSEIFRCNDISGVTVVRMEVPCCSKLVGYVGEALEKCGKKIPAEVFTVSSNGKVIDKKPI